MDKDCNVKETTPEHDGVLSDRPEPQDCQHEPPYPDHDTELFLFRYPEEFNTNQIKEDNE